MRILARSDTTGVRLAFVFCCAAHTQLRRNHPTGFLLRQMSCCYRFCCLVFRVYHSMDVDRSMVRQPRGTLVVSGTAPPKLLYRGAIVWTLEQPVPQPNRVVPTPNDLSLTVVLQLFSRAGIPQGYPESPRGHYGKAYHEDGRSQQRTAIFQPNGAETQKHDEVGSENNNLNSPPVPKRRRGCEALVLSLDPDLRVCASLLMRLMTCCALLASAVFAMSSALDASSAFRTPSRFSCSRKQAMQYL